MNHREWQKKINRALKKCWVRISIRVPKISKRQNIFEEITKND